MVQEGRTGSRRRWLICAGVSVLLAAAPATASAQSADGPRVARDAFPLVPRDREVSTTTAPPVEATSTTGDDTLKVALAVALAMLGGGTTAWFFTMRGEQTRRAMPIAIAGPEPIRTRPAAPPPPLWAGAATTEPEPPDRDRAWAAARAAAEDALATARAQLDVAVAFRTQLEETSRAEIAALRRRLEAAEEAGAQTEALRARIERARAALDDAEQASPRRRRA